MPKTPHSSLNLSNITNQNGLQWRSANFEVQYKQSGLGCRKSGVGDVKTRRQGEGEKGRNGRKISLSPCPLVPLSPCLPLSLSPMITAIVGQYFFRNDF